MHKYRYGFERFWATKIAKASNRLQIAAVGAEQRDPRTRQGCADVPRLSEHCSLLGTAWLQKRGPHFGVICWVLQPFASFSASSMVPVELHSQLLLTPELIIPNQRQSSGALQSWSEPSTDRPSSAFIHLRKRPRYVPASDRTELSPCKDFLPVLDSSIGTCFFSEKQIKISFLQILLSLACEGGLRAIKCLVMPRQRCLSTGGKD